MEGKIHTLSEDAGSARGPQYSEAAAGGQEGLLKASQMVLESYGEVAEMSSKTPKGRCLSICV